MASQTPPTDLTIRTASPSDAEALVAAIDEVAREGRFFLRSKFGQTPEVEAAFIELAIRHGGTILVAETGDRIVGWLTLQRDKTPFRRHVCHLGMGVLKPFRGQGIGRRLLDEGLCFARASAKIERVELAVRATNVAAIALYQTAGFAYEGRRMRAVRDDAGRYDDEILMAQATTTT
ncbi:MAG: GNAT family N-acetyltransferase [Anaerolineae bacterium]